MMWDTMVKKLIFKKKYYSSFILNNIDTWLMHMHQLYSLYKKY